MEKTNCTTKEIENYEHSFYCDECGEYLGTSEEYDDGWYECLGEFELSFYIDGWYRVEKCLCEDCAQKFLSNLKNHLEDMGFKRDQKY